MLERTSLLARVLYGAGIRRNDVISIISENRFEFPAITFGAFYLSAIVAPVNITYTERKIELFKMKSYLSLDYMNEIKLKIVTYIFRRA